MQNLFSDLKNLLQSNEKFCANGVLFKNKVVEMALEMDAELLQILLTHEGLKKHFFIDVAGILVFDKIKFQQFVNNKEFLPSSYTAFKNKIGLTFDEDYIKSSGEVVLSFPYKDCVLEGGQTKDEEKRKEIFYNQTLAPDQIDVLLKPKALTNFIKHDTKGEQFPDKIGDKDNLVIKGNNLLVLHSLKAVYRGKVKLIYIDPPYNTGNDSFKYNDSFNHSTWLVFMKNRLEVARELLREDGSIWINIDDGECHYLKVLCDEIFKKENFVANVVWQKKYSPQNDAKWLSDNHDHILVFAKNKQKWRPIPLERSEEARGRYMNPDNDPRGDWKSGDLSVKTYNAKTDYPITTPKGKIVYPPKGRCWRTSKEKFQSLVDDNRIWFGKDGNSTPSLKRFITDVKEGVTPLTLWLYEEVGHTQDAAQEIKALGFGGIFETPKPEKLLQRILHISTHEGDLVLDFFSGSGTTGAVAHKMNRQYILVEQMDYIHDLPETRLKKVIEGEQGGISKAVNWQGGGSFIYCELFEVNQKYVKELQTAENSHTLKEIWQRMEKENFIGWQLDALEQTKAVDEIFEIFTLEEQRQFLYELIDKNMLYLSHCEILDQTYQVSAQDIELNKMFYQDK